MGAKGPSSARRRPLRSPSPASGQPEPCGEAGPAVPSHPAPLRLQSWGTNWSQNARFQNCLFIFLFFCCFFAIFPPALAPFPGRVLPPPASPEHLHGWVPARAFYFSHQCHWQMQICLRGCNSGQAPDRGGVSNSHSPTARYEGSTPRGVRPGNAQNPLCRDT